MNVSIIVNMNDGSEAHIERMADKLDNLKDDLILEYPNASSFVFTFCID